MSDGKTLTTDGPFVEVEEATGGYLMFEADELDAAIELASRIPAARLGGAVEVRPATHDDDTILGWCDDNVEFEFALDLILDGLERLRDPA